jgi:hypothetical protein
MAVITQGEIAEAAISTMIEIINSVIYHSLFLIAKGPIKEEIVKETSTLIIIL